MFDEWLLTYCLWFAVFGDCCIWLRFGLCFAGVVSGWVCCVVWFGVVNGPFGAVGFVCDFVLLGLDVLSSVL